MVRIWPRPRPEVSLWERKARLHLAARRHVCRPEGGLAHVKQEREWELCMADQEKPAAALHFEFPLGAGCLMAGYAE